MPRIPIASRSPLEKRHDRSRVIVHADVGWEESDDVRRHIAKTTEVELTEARQPGEGRDASVREAVQLGQADGLQRRHAREYLGRAVGDERVAGEIVFQV